MAAQPPPGAAPRPMPSRRRSGRGSWRRSNRPELPTGPPSRSCRGWPNQGEYLASESTVYRILREERQLAPRGKAKPATRRRPEAPGGHRPEPNLDLGHHLLSDHRARRLLLPLPHPRPLQPQDFGWEVHAQESAAHAAHLFPLIVPARGGGRRCELTLHSDNGAPKMKGATMLATLQRLGVVPLLQPPGRQQRQHSYSEAPCSAPSNTPPPIPRGRSPASKPRGPGYASASCPGTTSSTATAPSGSSLRANAIAGEGRRSRCCEQRPPSMKPPRRNIRSAGPATSVTGSPSARCPSTRENRGCRRAATQNNAHG